MEKKLPREYLLKINDEFLNDVVKQSNKDDAPICCAISMIPEMFYCYTKLDKARTVATLKAMLTIMENRAVRYENGRYMIKNFAPIYESTEFRPVFPIIPYINN